MISQKVIKTQKQISELKTNQNKVLIKQKELENISNTIFENKSKLEKYSKHLEKENFLKENQRKINNKLTELKQKQIEINDKLEKNNEHEKQISNIKTTLKTEIEFKTKELEQKENSQKEFEKQNKQLQALHKKENFIINKITPIAQNIEKAVFTKYYVEFNEIFEKLFKELIEDNEIDVRLDEVFSIIVEQNGFDIDIKNLSGGEKSSLAIAYRLGLKQIIETNLAQENKLDLLILDEPTDGFSNEQIDRLGNILKNSGLKQTLLVSHDPKIESISDNTIHIEKVNHQSKVS